MGGRLKSKRTFATGAGQGIGRAVALVFARERTSAVAVNKATAIGLTRAVARDVTCHAALTTGTVIVVDRGQTP
jgi:NAD(P)-dependent dehydrogenase (short-subunit alcohol dehydrogenase family)